MAPDEAPRLTLDAATGMPLITAADLAALLGVRVEWLERRRRDLLRRARARGRFDIGEIPLERLNCAHVLALVGGTRTYLRSRRAQHAMVAYIQRHRELASMRDLVERARSAVRARPVVDLEVLRALDVFGPTR